MRTQTARTKAMTTSRLKGPIQLTNIGLQALVHRHLRPFAIKRVQNFFQPKHNKEKKKHHTFYCQLNRNVNVNSMECDGIEGFLYLKEMTLKKVDAVNEFLVLKNI